MKEIIKAIYEDGVIKPLEKLHIKEHEELTITIIKMPPRARPKKQAMALVGIFKSGIKNLSQEHDKYLYGWKKTK
ncbi:MAG: antitoxin family protein [Nitrospirota bacterium]